MNIFLNRLIFFSVFFLFLFFDVACNTILATDLNGKKHEDDNPSDFYSSKNFASPEKGDISEKDLEFIGNIIEKLSNSLNNTKREVAVKDGEQSKGRRALDAIARLLEGDEICAAISFTEERFYISTNMNGHIVAAQEPLQECVGVLEERVKKLQKHLYAISCKGAEDLLFTPQAREDFIVCSLPYLLIKGKIKLTEMEIKEYADQIKRVPEIEAQIHSLREKKSLPKKEIKKTPKGEFQEIRIKLEELKHRLSKINKIKKHKEEIDSLKKECKTLNDHLFVFKEYYVGKPGNLFTSWIEKIKEDRILPEHALITRNNYCFEIIKRFYIDLFKMEDYFSGSVFCNKKRNSFCRNLWRK